jgi:hypothetical protein
MAPSTRVAGRGPGYPPGVKHRFAPAVSHALRSAAIFTAAVLLVLMLLAALVYTTVYVILAPQMH